MPNLNEVNEPCVHLGYLERIPQRTDEKETLYFLSTVFVVLFAAATLLYFTYNDRHESKRVPEALSNIVTQLQNSVDEITFISQMEALDLPITLKKIEEYELEPFISNQFISPNLGCYIHQVEAYQLQLLYQSTEWRISWRADDHGGHHGDAVQELCADADHWQLISTHATTQ